MSANRERTVFIGNLDEKVSDRVLYDILIQAGRVVDLHIPRDRETDKPKGFAFAEYETEEIAEYAVKLFSGLVTLYSRTLRFAISGQDNRSSNVSTAPSQLQNSRQSSLDGSRHSFGLPVSCRVSEYTHQGVTGEPNGYGSHSNGNNYDYSRRTSESITRTKSRRYDASNPVSYRPY